MRKGQAEFIEWIPRLILFAVAVILIVVLVKHYSEREIVAGDIHHATYTYRMYHDGNIFTYKDKITGRVYPGIIDMDRLTGDVLDKTFNTRDPDGDKFGTIASKLTILKSGGCGGEGNSVYNDEITFNKYYSFAATGVVGGQSGKARVERIPVTFKKGDKLCPGVIEIISVRQNR